MRTLLLALAIALAGCAGPSEGPPPATADAPPPAGSPPALRLERAFDGFEQPLLLTHDGREGEVFVVEQGGRIWRLAEGAREIWLDVSADTVASAERGLLGLAFEPDGDRAYVSYTDRAGDSVLERVHGDGFREVLLRVDQPYSNHNGGHVAFGPDGFLYYGLGDGGSAGDPQGNGQDPDALLGSLLRLDVSGQTGYRNPPDNFRNEIWAKGLRNPWRFSFDRETGDLYIADVGQNKLEEIDFLPAGSPAGANFGWSVFEGNDRFSLVGRTFSEHTPPVAVYTHDDGCSVTGGHVYRGAEEPALVGSYFFGDYCSGKIWELTRAGNEWRLAQRLDTGHRISSFGEDAAGEVYLVDHAGSVWRLVQA